MGAAAAPSALSLVHWWSGNPISSVATPAKPFFVSDSHSFTPAKPFGSGSRLFLTPGFGPLSKSGLDELLKSWKQRRARTGGDAIWRTASFGFIGCVVQVWARTAAGATQVSSTVAQFSPAEARTANSARIKRFYSIQDVEFACLFWLLPSECGLPLWFLSPLAYCLAVRPVMLFHPIVCIVIKMCALSRGAVLRQVPGGLHTT